MAKKVIDQLVTELTADGAKMRAELKRSTLDARAWSRETRRHVNAGGKAFAATGAVAGAALAAIYSSAASAGDQLAKMSDRIGEAPERLVGLQHAAELTGAGANTLNSSLERMTKRLGEAKDGAGSAAKTLDKLGLTTEEFFALSPADQFSAIADKVSGLNTQQEKAAAAAALFGREGLALINTLDLGADGLASMSREADELGLTMSRLDLAKIESANDSFYRAQQVTEGFGRSLAVTVAPVLDAVSQKFVESAKEAGGFGESTRAIVDSTASGIGVMADGLHGIKILYVSLKQVLAEFLNASVQGFAFLDSATTDFLNTLPGVTAEQNASLQAMAANVSANAQIMRDEYQSLLLEPIPSEQIKAFIEDAYKKSESAAKQVSESTKINIPLQLDVQDIKSVGGDDAAETARQDALKKQLETQKNYQDLVRELRTDEEAVTAQLRERLAVLDAMGDISEAERGQALGRIADDVTEQAPDIVNASSTDGLEAARGELDNWYGDQLKMLNGFRAERADLGATWDAEELKVKSDYESRLTEITNANETLRRKQQLEGYSQLLNVAGAYFDGMEGKEAGYARAAIALGQTLLTEKGRQALKDIGVSTHTAAMGAYAAMAPIPFVGPVLAAAAAGAIYVAGGAAAAGVMGMAHDGIDAVPQTGTWLLEKGERVTTSKTSAKLDQTLSLIQGGLEGGRGSQNTSNSMRNNTQNIYVQGRVDNQTATQMQREADRRQRITQRRLG